MERWELFDFLSFGLLNLATGRAMEQAGRSINEDGTQAGKRIDKESVEIGSHFSYMSQQIGAPLL